MHNLILVNGNIHTMDPALPKVQEVVVHDGRIAYVGDSRTASGFKGSKSQVIDLKGQTVLPGFIESHMHPLWFGIGLLQVNCGPSVVPSMVKMAEKIKSVVDHTPKGEWILGTGWDHTKMQEKRFPNRWDLDKAAPDHPVFLKRTCAHMAVVNSKALALAGITKATPNPESGEIVRDPQSGEPTGMLLEQAMDLVPLPKYKVVDLENGMDLAQKEFGKSGVTMVNDMSAEEEGLRAYQNLLKKNQLSVRYRLWPFARPTLGYRGFLKELVSLGIQSGFGNEMVNIQGVKFILDGTIGGRTTALSEPYVNDPSNYGILYDDENGLLPDVLLALNGGLRISMHAKGDRAIEAVVRVMEMANKEVEVPRFRNRIEHCDMPSSDQLRRMKKLNMAIGSSCPFNYYATDMFVTNLGEERANRMFPQKSIQEMGLIAPLNSDGPVCGETKPLVNAYYAVTRKSREGVILGKDQAISVYDAIKAVTIDAAYMTFDENNVGSITIGKWADIIVLEDDPFRTDPENLRNIDVAMTLVQGQIVFQK